MGSHLYISIDVKHPGDCGWGELFEGKSMPLARSPIADSFGDCVDRGPDDIRQGYLSGVEIRQRAEHPDCPWHLSEPYWVREMSGEEFCGIVVGRRGDGLMCGPELWAFGIMVTLLLAQGLAVRVWCWHS